MRESLLIGTAYEDWHIVAIIIAVTILIISNLSLITRTINVIRLF